MNGHQTLFSSLAAIRTEIELVAFLRELASEFGFKGFMIVDIPAAVEQKLLPRIVLSNLPSGFIRSYDSLGLLKSSPVFAGLRRSTAPVTWRTETITTGRSSAEAEIALQLFSQHGMSITVYFPVHEPNGDRAAMGFFGDREDLTHREMGELGILVMHAYDVYSSLKTKSEGPETALTARELEVLHWAANGKTSTEIATIVSLSDHTINAYMNSAMRKLDCFNRTQLVAKALRLRLIS